MRCHWDEEDIWFYFEADAEGWVTRQVELQGPELALYASNDVVLTRHWESHARANRRCSREREAVTRASLNGRSRRVKPDCRLRQAGSGLEAVM
jgi:hypothetical protein